MSDNPHVQYANAKLRHKKQKSQGFHSDAKHAEREMIRISNLHKIKTGKHINDHAEALVAHHEKAKEIKRQYVQHSTDLIHAKKAGDKERMERAAKGKAQAEKDHLAHTGEPAEEKFVEYKRPIKEGKEMKTFKELYEACCAACEKRADIEEVKEPTGDLKKACWKGYTAVGMKMKNGRKVPNCVPAKEEVDLDEARNTYALYDDHPKFKDAHSEIHSAVTNAHKDPKAVVKAMRKHKQVGATDSASRDTIYAKVKRLHGAKVANSTKVLDGEVEQIDELWRTTVKSYEDKARMDQNDALGIALRKYSSPEERAKYKAIADKRGRGRALALAKLSPNGTRLYSDRTVAKQAKVVAKEEVEQTDEQAPVAPTLDRKFLKGTPEHKAYKASKVRQKYRFVWNKTGAKKIRVPVKEAAHVGIYPHGGGSDIHHDNEPDDEVTNHSTSNAVGNEPHKGNEYFRRPKIKKYVGQIRKSASQGKSMPPVIGTPHPENPEVKSVVDGNHRLRGQQNARRENIPVQNVPHHRIHLMPQSYEKTPESKDMGQKIKTHGVPLSSLRNKNGTYDMDKPRHQLGGKTIRHYFTNTDGTHNFGEPPKPANEEVEQVGEAVFQGKKVPLNKPMAGDVKKSKVYVDPDGDGTAQKVNFGDKNMTIKKHIPGRRKNFRARHNCDNPGPKTKARYWSCKAW